VDDDGRVGRAHRRRVLLRLRVRRSLPRSHVHGQYHEVAPGERVSYPWQAGVGETRVDVEVRPGGDGAELTLRHTGWGSGSDAEEAVALHEQGWNFFLDNLVAYLDRGEDMRAGGPMGQKTPATV
jgi:uncharacterized protein YndB with AHSA1/START domain